MASGPISAWQIEGKKVEVVTDFLFLGSKITADGDCSHEIRRWLLLGRKAMTNLDSVFVEKQRHYRTNKALYSQGYGLPRGHIQLWGLVCKEGRVPKNWYLWTVALEKTPESPFDSKEIKPVSLNGNQPWILFGRTDAIVETLVFWSSDANSWLTGKVPDSGKDWGQKEKRVSEDEMAGWHHQCNGHEFGQISGSGKGQRGLASCSLRGGKESDMTGWLNNNSNNGPFP